MEKVRYDIIFFGTQFRFEKKLPGHRSLFTVNFYYRFISNLLNLRCFMKIDAHWQFGRFTALYEQRL